LAASLAEFASLAVALGLLVFGLTLILILRNRGGPELAFARLLADSRRRTIFLGALYTSLAALFGIGLTAGLGVFLGASATEMSLVRSALFIVGSVGIFIIMIDALHTSPLTLEEGWNLKETAARVSNLPSPLPPPIDVGSPPRSSERWSRRPGP
jgi:hypothetical protein